MNSGGAILISGASSGIGRELACVLAQRTDAIIYAGVRKEADEVALNALKLPQLRPVFLDVTKQDSVDQAMAWIARENHPLRAVINNAGIVISGPLEFLPLPEMQAQLEVNVLGVLRLTQAALPYLRQNKGRVINMGSMAGQVSLPFMGAYAASKHALEALSDALRRELASSHVPVVLIQPGMVRTPIWTTAQKKLSEIMSTVPPQGQALYQKPLQNLLRQLDRSQVLSSHPQLVCAAVMKALLSSSPRTRYRVGKDATLAKVFTWFTDRWQDLFFKQLTGA